MSSQPPRSDASEQQISPISFEVDVTSRQRAMSYVGLRDDRTLLQHLSVRVGLGQGLVHEAAHRGVGEVGDDAGLDVEAAGVPRPGEHADHLAVSQRHGGAHVGLPDTTPAKQCNKDVSVFAARLESRICDGLPDTTPSKQCLRAEQGRIYTCGPTRKPYLRDEKRIGDMCFS